MAARVAVAVYAYAEAVRLTEHALQVHEVLDPQDKTKRCDLLLGLGHALMPSGGPRRAFEVIAPQALALAEALEDRGRASTACQLALSGMMRYGSGTMLGTPEYRQWAERADSYAHDETRERVRADFALSAVRYAEERRTESWNLARLRSSWPGSSKSLKRSSLPRSGFWEDRSHLVTRTGRCSLQASSPTGPGWG